MQPEKVKRIIERWNSISQELQDTDPDSFVRIVATAEAPEKEKHWGET
ncbi:MAG: hypothetical protein JSV57_05255 [Candidatus Bathyarchaeota archaeon]|nr:MAG: hypothetical protein JSV57_05255 [Candidatus Bathyarchaeota archaeon]